MRVRTSSTTVPTVPENILDIYTGAVAAYSLRKLRKAYTGAAIRIRRDDDNLEVDVPFDGFNGLGASGFETFLRSFCGGFGTNYILGSETFSPSFWGYTNSTLTSSAGQSPIATSNASKLVETTATGEHNFSCSIGGYGSGARFSTSCYVKAAERNFAYVRLQEDVAPFSKAGVVVNLTTLQTQADTSVPNNEFSNISVYATNVGNGWVRISVAANVNTLNSVSTVVGSATSLTTISYVGNTSSGILIWGAQAQDGDAGIYDWKGNTSSASAFVTTWYDQSGNVRDVTQTTAASQPRIVNSGVVDKINGIPSARFSFQFLNSAANIQSPSGGLATVISVLPSVTGSYRGISLFATISENEYVRFSGDGLSYPFLGRTLRTELVNAGMPASNALVFSHINNGSNHLLYRNKVLGATAALNGAVETSATCSIRIGASFISDGNYISENILFPRVLSLQEKLTIEDNMMSFYGIN